MPASVRHRWHTSTVVAEDLGDRLLLRPVPDDPIDAAVGSLRDYIDRPIEEIRARVRQEEQDLEERKLKRYLGGSA